MTLPKKGFPPNGLTLLEEYKEKTGSWDLVAEELNIPKRTIMRWRSSKRISPAYQRLLEHLLNRKEQHNG